MGILIDSSILIHFEKSGTDVSAYVSGREDEDVFVSVVSASELLHGVHRVLVGCNMCCTWSTDGNQQSS